MLRHLLFVCTIAAAMPLAWTADVSAAETVRYRLVDWKRKHVHDTDKAKRTAETLKKLGCEVEMADHNGHIDVRYRRPEWGELSVDTKDEADRWEKWFKVFYFEVQRKSSRQTH